MTRTISIIAAVANNGVIGNNGRIPWHIPADMSRFARLTMGKPVIMGRKTYESIPVEKRPLHGRLNIILTRERGYKADGCVVVYDWVDALNAAGDVPEVMIIGGASVYKKYLPYADTFYLTLVNQEPEGDTEFPVSLLNFDWWPTHDDPASEYTFVTLGRVGTIGEGRLIPPSAI